MDPMRVMSFNIAGGYDDDEPGNAWTTSGRAELACQVIEAIAPDLIGLQEAEWPNFATFGRELAEYDSFQGPHAEDTPHLYNPIYWRRGRLCPLARGGFWLSEMPERHSGSWDTAEIRAATWVRFRHLESGREFLYVNTHLDHISEAARVGGAKLLEGWLEANVQDGDLQLLAGDFNSNPWRPQVEPGAGAGSTFTDEIHRFFLACGFVDCFLEAGLQDGPDSNTYHGYEGAAYDLRGHHLAWRLDWILLRGAREEVKINGCAVVRHHQGALYPSDHYPLWADLTWGN
ncbi:MAG: hypothetical protein GKR89_25695 [Candidatus Latescibacteria bacterium]|nr:hypothetical protein [Candidatus Latescibacterota bacterium]